MRFEEKKIITGITRKVSKKTNKEYTMANFLNDDGTSFSSLVADGVLIPQDIKQLSQVKVMFEVTFYNGNINGLRTVNLELLKTA